MRFVEGVYSVRREPEVCGISVVDEGFCIRFSILQYSRSFLFGSDRNYQDKP